MWGSRLTKSVSSFLYALSEIVRTISVSTWSNSCSSSLTWLVWPHCQVMSVQGNHGVNHLHNHVLRLGPAGQDLCTCPGTVEAPSDPKWLLGGAGACCE
jgi:hypothetical protein